MGEGQRRDQEEGEGCQESRSQGNRCLCRRRGIIAFITNLALQNLAPAFYYFSTNPLRGCNGHQFFLLNIIYSLDD